MLDHCRPLRAAPDPILRTARHPVPVVGAAATHSADGIVGSVVRRCGAATALVLLLYVRQLATVGEDAALT